MKRPSGFYLLIPILVLVLAACMREPPQVRVPAGAYAGDLKTEPCKVSLESALFEADCGLLVVPENRADPVSRLIALPVTRVRSISETPAEPIFYLEGGPGASNTVATPPSALLENHDFVLVGYRGVDGSVILDCPEVATALKGDGRDVLSESSLTGLAASMDACAGRLENEGVDLAGYTIEEVVHDLDAARQGFGYEQVNLVSFSYGTRVAQAYAYLHPESVYRSAMISVNPPGRFVWEPDTIDAQIRYYSDLYALSASPRVADLAETMKYVSANMPERWLVFRIDPGKVKSTAFAMLFHRNTAAMVFDAYIAASEGDAAGLWVMSVAYDFVIPSMSVWGEFFSKGVSADYDAARDYLAEMDPPGSIIGSPMSRLIWGAATINGEVHWPTPLMPEDLRTVQPSDVRTLLVSGNIDLSTPAEFATADFLPSLSDGEQVLLSEFGHVNDVMLLQPDATLAMLVTFFDTGIVDASGFTYAPASFEVGTGFPALAKILLFAAVVVPAVLILGVWWLVRRIRRARSSAGAGK